MKVLFVCLGNICRSPLAQGILDNYLQKQGITDWTTDSAGTSNWHVGESPDPRTIRNAKDHNIQLPYKGRQVNTQDFHEFDYILVMDNTNLSNLMQFAPQSYKAKIHKMRDFDNQNPGADVLDPYFGGEEGFEKVFQILERSILNFVAQVG